MKIFLSLGFSGRSKEEVFMDIGLAMIKITDIHVLINDNSEVLQFIHNYDYNGNTRVECLGEAIKKMSACDKVYFINDWENHKGCVIEKKVCELYNIPHESISV